MASMSADVLGAVETIGGKIVGQVVKGQARYPLQVQFVGASRDDISALEDLQVAAAQRRPDSARATRALCQSEGPVSIWRQNPVRRVTLAVNVRGTDLESFVSAAKNAVEDQAKLPSELSPSSFFGVSGVRNASGK